MQKWRSIFSVSWNITGYKMVETARFNCPHKLATRSSARKSQLSTTALSHNSCTSWQPPSTSYQVALSPSPVLHSDSLTPQIPMSEIEMDQRRTTTWGEANMQKSTGISVCSGGGKSRSGQREMEWDLMTCWWQAGGEYAMLLQERRKRRV